MKNKYFTPEITDYCVGYECEIKEYVNTDWYTHIISEDDLSYGDSETGYTFIPSHSNRIRTPYLNKEQIEKEGWTLTYDDIKQDVMSFKKENYEILYYLNEHNTCSNEMTIWYFYLDGLEQKQVFDGKITNINDFRILMKFLGI